MDSRERMDMVIALGVPEIAGGDMGRVKEAGALDKFDCFVLLALRVACESLLVSCDPDDDLVVA